MLTSYAAGTALEQVYQRALEDPEFKAADGELNAAYSRHMRALPREERDKLRQAERFWIRENQELTQQNTEQAVDLLKKRFLKRRDELVALSLPQDQTATKATPAEVTSTQPAPTTPPAEKGSSVSVLPTASDSPSKNASPTGWSEKVAANLERVYQSALQDSEFESADLSLRSVFKQTLSALKPADREMLRPAQKHWVRENAVLVAAQPGNERAVLLSRVLERKAQLERMLETRRFEAAAPAQPTETASAATAQDASRPSETIITLPPPVIKEAALPPPSVVETTSAPAPPAESDKASKAGDAAPSMDNPNRFFWALLGTWILGLAFFHYRALMRAQDKSFRSSGAPLNVRGLYLATGTGFLVSLIPLFSVPSAFTAVTGVLFTIAGLGTAKIAAEEWARPAASPARKPLPTSTPAKAALSPTEAETKAVAVHSELQPSPPVGKRKGSRQKRRRN